MVLIQVLQAEKQAGTREGVGLVDLIRCFDTIEVVDSHGNLKGAAWFVMEPHSLLLQGWDWTILLLTFYFFWEVPVNLAFRTSSRLGAPFTM
jgi:hypothetical protein